MPPRSSRLAVVLVAIWSTSGCKGSSEGGPPPPPPDTVAPTVVDAYPTPNAVDVPVGVTVAVWFSEEMDPATVSTASFFLRDGAGALVPGAVSYAGGHATFTPSAPLALSTTYSAYVTQGAADAAGNPLQAPASWSFATVAPPPDTTPPTVVARSPVPAAVGVPLDAVVTVTFDEPVAASSLGGIVLRKADVPVDATVTLDASATVATLAPSAPLASDTTYQVGVTAPLQDLAGNTILPPVYWYFTTVDVTPPEIASVHPLDGTTADPDDELVWVEFSEPMSASAAAGALELRDGGGSLVPGVVSTAGSVVSFTPDAPLPRATTFAVTVTTGMQDLAGNPLAAPATWTFTTVGPDSGAWTAMAPATALGSYAARGMPSAVWTGTEMIVWGGYYFGPQMQVYVLANGGRYSPATDTWSFVSSNLPGTPAGRFRHATVWTGSRMIVWGGAAVGGLTNTGGVYDPGVAPSGAWSPTTTAGAPTPRADATAVWTGSEMVVWGGWSPTIAEYYGSGARYDPVQDLWTPMSDAGAPSPRVFPAAAWTSSGFVVWGGQGPNGALGDGAVYHPASDTWSPITAVNAPSPRRLAAAQGTGSRLLVWGGGGELLGDGSVYDPATDAWAAMTDAGAPPPRDGASTVWTGTRLVLWGGEREYPVFTRSGGVYDLAADAWATVALAGAPSAREHHAAVWTGTQMIVWGGAAGGTVLGDGARFTP